MAFGRSLTTKLAMVLLIGIATLPGLPASADVRILLDVSKSMAENDPQNQRTEALLSLTDAIPSGEKAGVWTFGQYVNLLVPHRPVDSAWRRETTVSLRNQGAPAIRTNMGRALEEAAYDFNFSTYTGSADVILISDGKVDIAPNDDVNNVERERILNQLVPLYKSANARIHTIAISNNADRALLQEMSTQTGGRFELVTDTARLNRSLARLTAIIAPQAQSLPLQNYFDVAEGLLDVTVWVPHERGAIALVAPDGEQTSAVSPAQQKWQVGPGYSQVTVTSPQAGRWQLKGELNQNQKVLVYEDIRLQWTQPDNDSVISGQPITLSAQLVDGKGNVVESMLLSQLNAQLNVDGRENAVRVANNQISARLFPPVNSTRLTLELTANAGTFSRTIRRQVGLVEPFVSEWLTLVDAFEWRLYPNPMLSDRETLIVTAEYELNGERYPIEFQQKDGLYWYWQLPFDAQPGDYALYLGGTLAEGDNMMVMPQQQMSVTLPPANRMVVTSDPLATIGDDTMTSGDFVKDPMPEFAELQADIVVDQGSEWVDEPLVDEDAPSESRMGTYLMLTLPAILFLAVAYLFYRRLEQKAQPKPTEDDLILGGDEFAGLDDIRAMTPDSDLDLSVLDEYNNDDFDDLPEPVTVDDYESELPPPAQTEAPSPAQEDMLAEQSDMPIEDSEPEADTVVDPDEELFDISSIDDDLADLDLALDGDDPFAEAEDKK